MSIRVHVLALAVWAVLSGHASRVSACLRGKRRARRAGRQETGGICLRTTTAQIVNRHDDGEKGRAFAARCVGN